MSTSILIKNLLSNSLFDHPVSRPRIIETHVTWVILTSTYAYKIKKPVNFGFLDFSTLEKRKHFCEEELRLGQQFASEIYLSIVTITGTLEHPQINGTGPILEYAIKMVEFPQENLLSAMLKNGSLTENIIDQLSKLIAEFHNKTPVATKKSRFGQPKEVHAPTKQNFEQIAPLLTDPADINQLKHLEIWSEQQFKQLHTFLQFRKDHGFIRDCHGDLHLENIIYYKNRPILFDRLEFNEDLRWTDVIADLAFIVMDLTEKKQLGFANQLVNTYFHYTEDYQGLTLLPYYLAYRAVVRAKIALFRLKQEKLACKTKKEIQSNYYNFINLAESYTKPPNPLLIITHGVTGSGKTTIAKQCVKYCGAIQINSDIVRKKLFNIPLHGHSNSELNSGIYTDKATKATYKKLADLAEVIIKAGFTVIVDATFLRHAQRTSFYTLAKKLNVPFYILHCQGNTTQIQQRIKNRMNSLDSVSEADLSVLLEHKKNNEPLTDLEKKHTLIIEDEQVLSHNILNKICNHLHFTALI